MKVRVKLIPKRKKKQPNSVDARRFASNVSTAILIVGTVVGLVMIANRWAAKEEMRSIRIVGRAILDSAEIMAAAAIADSLPLHKLDLDAIEHRITGHPFIARASVYRGENGTLVLDITERAPVALALIDGAPLYIDSLGVPLPYRFSSAGFDLPVISGIGRARAGAGAPGSDSAASRPASSAARLDSVATREALGVLAALKSYDDALYRQISEIRREPWGEYLFITADGAVPVRAGYPAEIASRLRKLDRFMTTVLAAKGVEKVTSIDLRWKGQVVVRWKSGDRVEA
jgi:POTRA domain, FtsQ-type/Cell division protein FtsQ